MVYSALYGCIVMLVSALLNVGINLLMPPSLPWAIIPLFGYMVGIVPFRPDTFGWAPLPEDDNWQDDAATDRAMTKKGSDPLPSDSKDAAMVVGLQSGAYSVSLLGKDRDTGVGMIEIYEAEWAMIPSPSAPPKSCTADKSITRSIRFELAQITISLITTEYHEMLCYSTASLFRCFNPFVSIPASFI